MKRFALIITLLACIGVVCAAPIIQAISVTVGSTPAVIDGTSKEYPISVTMIPQSGVTGTIEYSTSPNAYAAPGSANWAVLGAASAVSAVTYSSITSPVTAIRFSRVSGASSVIGEVDWKVAP